MNEDSSIKTMPEMPGAVSRLSPQQAHVWALNQAGAALHVCCEVEIEGLLDPERLRLIIAKLCADHPILRSRLVHQSDPMLPLQTSCEGATWINMLDISNLTPVEQTVRLDDLWSGQVDCREDWAAIPALRVHLVRISESISRLILTICPVFGDEYTLDLLVKAIAHAYCSSSGPTSLFAGGLQYSQFAEWQNELCETEDASLQEARDYWSTRPPGIGVTDLPTLQNDQGQLGLGSITISKSLDDRVSEEIASGAANCCVTENELMFAAWVAFLWRWTKFESASINYTSNGRPFEELQGVMGLVTRCLPTGIDLTGETTFRSLCDGSHVSLTLALEWQDYFLFAAKSQDEIGVFPDPDFGFSYGELSAVQTDSGPRWTVCREESTLERHRLHLVCTRENNRLNVKLLFDKCTFSQTTAKRLLNEFIELLQDAALNPEQRIDRLQMLAEDEAHELLVRFNDTSSLYPDAQCFHELFEEQVLRTPDAVAVRCVTAEVTYRELNERADNLAANLAEYGVGPERLVAICLSRSIEMIVAILGVLKAGAAYVPLDSSSPLERMAWILEDSTPVLILTASSLYDRLPGSSIPVYCLDENMAASNGVQAGQLVKAVPQNLAYIIYTSGSTGQPKGVMVPHQGLVNYLHWCTSAYQLSEGSGTLVDTPIGFDLTVTSMLAPLIVGQTAVLVPEDKGIESLAEALRTSTDVTLVKTTPAHMEVLRNLLPNAAASASRRFVIGGEALNGETLSFWHQLAPETIFVNEYGPTETVVGCCIYQVSKDSDFIGPVPIGRPIANTRLYILNDYLQPVPIGMPGELYIGGSGVVRGYLNRADLTAEKFIPDAFGDEPGCRLYRTGDVCKYLEDGNIVYVCRTDHQVKLRGFRIEPGEIENLLLLQDTVREAVVVVREDSPGDRRLVGYVVNEGADTDTVSLLGRLRDKLPEYMVPYTIVCLARLPLTSHGKVDRDALPAPIVTANQDTMDGPRNPVEQVIAGIWGELLGTDEIGIHQDFFALGGHSLLATQAISYVRETFQVEVPLLALFQAPSIAAFAELILRDPETRDQIESVANLLGSLSELTEAELEERLQKLAVN